MLKAKIVIPIWTFLNSGGMRVLTKLANYFNDHKYDTLIVTYYKSDEPYFPIKCPIQYVDDYGKIVQKEKRVMPQNIIDFNIDKFYRFRSLKRALNRLSSDYNVVLANYHLTAFSVNYSNFLYKFYYIQAYEAWYKGFIGYFYNFFARKSYKFNLIKIVNSDLYRNYKEIESQFVIPPGIDLNLFYSKSFDRYWDQKRRLIIGHIGRKEEWKGSKDVAMAIKLLQDEGINIEYRVAFNPPERESCDFTLVIPNGDASLSEYYRSLDVLIAPGQIQLGAIHYPVIEAMACGTTVITTGYYPANNDNAYIVGVKRPDDIANAVKDIINNYSVALKKIEMAKKVISNFAWDIICENMLSIIDKCIIDS